MSLAVTQPRLRRFDTLLVSRQRPAPEMVSAGIPEIDCLTGGLPRGGLTEIFGSLGSGRTSLLLAALASVTSHGEACALVDAGNSLDPHSAEAAGVELRRLLWIRCKDIEPAMRATDLLLQGGGFGLVALDLGDLAPRTAGRVPLNVWFRFRQAVENAPTVLIVLEQEPHARTCASMVLHLEGQATTWSDHPGIKLPHAYLLQDLQINAEVCRLRFSLSSAPPASLCRFAAGVRRFA